MYGNEIEIGREEDETIQLMNEREVTELTGRVWLASKWGVDRLLWWSATEEAGVVMILLRNWTNGIEIEIETGYSNFESEDPTGASKLP